VQLSIPSVCFLAPAFLDVCKSNDLASFFHCGGIKRGLHLLPIALLVAMCRQKCKVAMTNYF
jgi:hypothetical protein